MPCAWRGARVLPLVGLLSTFIEHGNSSELQLRALSTEAIEAAITAGVEDDLSAYPLYSDDSRQEHRANLTASVYTPFLRVAMWARQRWREQGKPPAVNEIPAALTQPTLIIAVHNEPLCCPAVAPEPPLRVCAAFIPQSTAVVFPCENTVPNSRQARWTTQDRSVLQTFDRTIIPQIAFVAAFELDDVRAGWYFVTEQHRRAMSETAVLRFVGSAPVTSRDLERWR